MNPTFHRGALVKSNQFPYTFAVARRPKCEVFQHAEGTALTASLMSGFSKQSRQRRKGAITRYGVSR